MSKLPYMPFYINDYMADAGHLPTLAHGAYFLLLVNYWQRQGPIPCDDFTLQGITKLSDGEWERLRPHLARFFQERDGHWHHKRVDAEIERANGKIEQYRDMGRRSVERRLNRSSTAVEPTLQPDANQSPTSKVKAKDNTTRLSSNEDSRRSSTTTTEMFDDAEIKRRCVEATGWQFSTGFSRLADLIRGGVDLESRVLPILRQLRDNDAVTSWIYAVKAIEDAERTVEPAEKEIETVFVEQGSVHWRALCTVKRESYLNSISRAGPNGGASGVWWPKRDLPTLQAAE